ncbi:hypothetical protein QO010_000060 [Caulobacter ginsengisoli]|uniref:Uncharacterized protein n=1 Tax=Caulobacter ginsengisoli TaxID=400775 RepID=A0ABU0IJX5_9CAUL|nr:hypothetical protein [Caulobacter ginsengisoli]MDQ0462312.1 hypothetical protein [Caulobacter ginsengisoli]
MMRSLFLVALLSLAAASARAASPEEAFLDRLQAMAPVELQVAAGLGPPDPAARVRLAVPAPGQIELRTIAGPRAGQIETLAFQPSETGGLRVRLARGPAPVFDPDEIARCGAELEGEDILAIECSTRRGEMSRALIPPLRIYTIFLEADGPRLVAGGDLMGRIVYSPAGAKPAGPLTAGLQSNLADALRQMAAGPAAAPGRLPGGASGRGNWYGTDLLLTEVAGLDFVLARTADREAEARQVSTHWAFVFQPGEPDTLVWRMRRSRPGAADRLFWCVGRPVGDGVEVACHPGRRAPAGADPAVAFRLAPFPEWSIQVEAGEDNPYATVGSARLKTRPAP